MGKETVLALLLREKGHFVSGEAVSAELGITRAAIWKSISALRAQGGNALPDGRARDAELGADGLAGDEVSLFPQQQRQNSLFSHSVLRYKM